MTSSRHRMLAALASGPLMAAAFPSFDQSYLAWFAYVPLLVAIRGISPRRAAGYGWLSGFGFFVVTLYWVPGTISSFTTISPLLAAGVLMLMAAATAYSSALFAFCLEALARAGAPRLLAGPALWVVAEWMRGFVIAEFPWNLLGYSQLRYLPMAQAADLGGVYLISAALVLANLALAEALAQMERRKLVGGGPGPILSRLALALACPLLLFGYGTLRLQQLQGVPYESSIRVGIAQGNVAQDQKWDAELGDHIFKRYLKLSQDASSAGAQLVVWPEAALPFYMNRDARSLELVEVAQRRGLDLLIGAPGAEDRDGQGLKPYNQAWLIRASGDIVGPYDKIQLVPFGEYIPMRGLFGLVDVAVQSIGELGRGSQYTIFETANLTPLLADAGSEAGAHGAAASQGSPARPARFATLICYEGIFPGFTRRFAAAGADFLVNISNDAWYGDTAAPQQHLTMAAMRSIENRLPMVRSTNTGISAFVTDEGRIGPRTRLFETDMMVEAVLIRDVWSLYRSFGDVFLHLCQLLLVFLIVQAYRRRRGSALPPEGSPDTNLPH